MMHSSPASNLDSFVKNDDQENEFLGNEDLTEYLIKVHNLSSGKHDIDQVMDFLNHLGEVSGYLNLTSADKDTTSKVYCDFFQIIHTAYNVWHFKLSVVVATLGFFTNLLTLLILTRHKTNTSTNLFLMGITIADMLVSLEYIPYGILQMTVDSVTKHSHTYALYILIRAHCSQVFHTIAIWLTAVLAYWRWLSVCRPHEALSKCSPARAKKVVIGTFILCPILASPTFILYSVQEADDGIGATIYVVNFSSFVVNNQIIWKVIFFLYSCEVKLVPCGLLIVLIPAIIKGMIDVTYRRSHIHSKNSSPSTGLNSRNNSNFKKKEIATERTTHMLVVILLIFLLAELPQGLLTGLTLVYGQDFFKMCYLPMSDFMDLLALCNATVNFFVYCFMSQDFREKFHELCAGSRDQWNHLSFPKKLQREDDIRKKSIELV